MARLETQDSVLEVRFGSGAELMKRITDQTVAGKRVVVLTAAARDRLDYQIIWPRC